MQTIADHGFVIVRELFDVETNPEEILEGLMIEQLNDAATRWIGDRWQRWAS
jgi:hypothetical protein